MEKALGNWWLPFEECRHAGGTSREDRRAAPEAGTQKYMAKPLDYAEYGGAPLMGIKGGLIICHGASKAKAIKNAIHMAMGVCQEHLDEIVMDALKQMENNEA